MQADAIGEGFLSYPFYRACVVTFLFFLFFGSVITFLIPVSGCVKKLYSGAG